MLKIKIQDDGGTKATMKVLRKQIEEREEKWLAPFAAKSSQAKRTHKEKEHPYRTAFQRDRDRIIHSVAFRRLQYKTQVFINYEGDEYRTRLTHTLEVAQIGRTLARALAVNETLTEAIALAHDLGHPPFGHAGEVTLDKLMRDYGGFDHNFQSYRVVTSLEEKYPHFPGLNLTADVLEGLLKHETKFDRPKELAEKELSVIPPGPYPSVEAQIVDIADEIAYHTHDLDDGLNSKIISPTNEELLRLSLWERARLRFPGGWSDRLRHQIINYIIGILVGDVIETTRSLIDENKLSSADEIRNFGEKIVSFSERTGRMLDALHHFLLKRLYGSWKVARMNRKSGRLLEEVWEVFTKDYRTLPSKVSFAIEETLGSYSRILSLKEVKDRQRKERAMRQICDYIVHLTDRELIEEYQRIFEPLRRV